MNKLIIAESFNNADMYYATGILVPDAFAYISIDGKEYIIANRLEFGRVEKSAGVGVEVLLQKQIIEKEVLDFLVEKEIKEISVALDFSVNYADFFRENGIKVTPATLFPERIIKTKDEIEKIIGTQRVIEDSFYRAVEVIKESEVKDGALYFEGEKLTSEKLKEEISIVFIKNQVEVADTIVSCGESSAYPHDLGSGVILSGEPIILDIYPRSTITRYYSDMTRTVCKGEPNNPKVKEMYDIVLEAQSAGYSKLKEGVTGDEVHNEVVEVFKKHGLEEYFIHGTGHGVGLDIHESPRVAKGGIELKEGMIVTNEPGLYIPGVGGVRIEDTVAVTKDGYENLAVAPKEFII